LALILSAIITPDATLFTMLLMAVPLIILYEIGIWGAKVFGRVPQPAENEQAETESSDTVAGRGQDA
jgi:Sec-independent protein secretion pathway component TatC